MDLRQILDVGASPQAPPGRKPEPPPKVGEFEKTLKTAKKEETPGEVAENEPNAQLQKLDSEKDSTETKTSVDKAPNLPAFQVPFDLVNANQPNMVELSQWLTNGAMQGFTLAPSNQAVVKDQVPFAPKACVAAPAVMPTSNDIKVDPTVVQADSTPIDVKLDATQNEAITNLVASAFAEKGSPITRPKPMPASMVQTDTKSDQKPVITRLLPTESAAALNITSVKSVTTAQAETVTNSAVIEKQVVAAPQPALAEPKVKQEKGTVSAASNVINEAVGDAVKAETQTQSQSQGKSSDTKDESKDKSETVLPTPTSNTTSIDVPVDAKPVQTHQLTTAERQAAVDIISRKIDELAAKSVRNEVRVEMHPPDLGSVVVNIRKDMAGITATLNASNEPLRQALHESRNDLAGALADRNVGQVRIEVRGASADTMNMGQQFNQAQSQQHHHNQQNQQAKMATQTAARQNREDKSIDEPVRTRVATTLLDLEI